MKELLFSYHHVPRGAVRRDEGPEDHRGAGMSDDGEAKEPEERIEVRMMLLERSGM